MLDLAKECQQSPMRPSIPLSAPNTSCTSRRESGSSLPQQQQRRRSNTSATPSSSSGSNNHPYYPLQFSTRTKAMEFLIEILQSLQKEPCGCDLTKGCYCGADGVEDHEGKSPCYVCGEWFPDRKEPADTGVGAEVSSGDPKSQGPSSSSSHSMQGQGRAWHEQGSLRHHVAESRVKKWLDSVWRPPLTPAISPEQGNVQHFGSGGKKIQDDHWQRLQQPQPYQQQYQDQCDLLQYQLLTPHSPTWNQVLLEHQGQYQHAQLPSQQQQQEQRMDPGRSWSFHDIEIEARTKSRSRQNYSSSVCSNSSASHHGHHSSPVVYQQQQQDLFDRSNHGSGSGSWRIVASPKPIHAISPFSSSPHPSHPHAAMLPSPQPQPRSVPALNSHPHPPDHFLSTRGALSTGMYPTWVRAQSCSDSQQQQRGQVASPLMAFTPPMARPSSSHSLQCSSRPARAQSTFAIPQEILDPSYKSPTFRIKSWSPPVASGETTTTTTAATVVAPIPVPGSITPLQVQQVSSEVGSKAISDLHGERQAATDRTFSATNAEVAETSFHRERVEKSSLWTDSDQQDVAVIPQAAQQGNTREQGSMVPGIPTSSKPFRFSFTSERFRAVVQASLQSADPPSTERENQVNSTKGTGVQPSTVHPEIRVNELLIEDEGALGSVTFQEGQPSIKGGGTVPTDVSETILLKATLPGSSCSSSHHIDSSNSTKDIQKSEPMSPLTPKTLSINGAAASAAGGDHITVAACFPDTTLSCTSPPFSSSSSSTGSPTSPVYHAAAGIDANSDPDVGTGTNKGACWTSLQRLMRKVTKNNDSMMASLSLSRNGRMHLEGS